MGLLPRVRKGDIGPSMIIPSMNEGKVRRLLSDFSVRIQRWLNMLLYIHTAFMCGLGYRNWQTVARWALYSFKKVFDFFF